MKFLTLSTLLFCLLENEFSNSLKLPGPLVYVVTPSPGLLTVDEGRSATQPFYYQSWLRRMNSPMNTTTTSTTRPTPTLVKTPDLIFAEFDSHNMKNIRKLLEKERIDSKMSSSAKPIYVPDEIMHEESENYDELPTSTTEREDMKTSAKDMTDYFAWYNSMYNSENNFVAPVYVPSSTSTQKPITTSTSETPTTSNNVRNIWHIIDSEKRNQYYDGWNEVPISMHAQNGKQDTEPESNHQKTQEQIDEDDKADQIDNNFALPG